MCFTGLAYADLKAITYKHIITDSDGGTWLMGNRIKTGVAYVVKLLPIAIELIEKYRGVDDKKISPDRVFPVGDMSSMYDSLRIIGKKCDCSVEVTPHIAKHNKFYIQLKFRQLPYYYLLIGNIIETSELQDSVSFCIHLKNDFSNANICFTSGICKTFLT